MRIAHLPVMASAALLVFVAGASALTAQPRASATAPLLPLSEADLTSTSEMGCECSFNRGRDALARVIGNELTIRTGSGLQACRISDAEFAAFSAGRADRACGGVQLNLRRTGRVSSHPESDSAEWPASLGVSRGRARRTLAGRWGCAC